jgi:hypothetical protein
MKRRAPQLKQRTTTVQSNQDDCDPSCERLGNDASKHLEDGNRMSKIMRHMYAEARAAREAAARAKAPRVRGSQLALRNPVALKMSGFACWALPVSDPVASARSTLHWWATRIDMARERFMPAPG